METKKIIFDTDIGGDCDDVIALDLLLSACKAGECDLIGITYSYFCLASCGCIYEILRQHGYEKIPIGRMPIPEEKKKYRGTYAYQTVEKFGREDTPAYESTPDAVRLLRELLAENTHVTIAVVGSMTNIAALIESCTDDISPLGGKELMIRSVDEIAVMGCSFRHQDARNPQPEAISEDGTLKPVCEWNIFCDIPAARLMFDNCPVPIVCSPFELGYNLYSGQPVFDAGKGETPDSFCMQVYGCCKHGHHSWDPATVYYALYGALPYFYKTAKGKITVDENGIAYFDAAHGGNHSIIECALPRDDIGAAIDEKLKRLYVNEKNSPDILIEILRGDDQDIETLKKIHREPSVAGYISASDNYFEYVTGTAGVVYYKIVSRGTVVGGIHLETAGEKACLSVCVGGKYRRRGIAETALKLVIADLSPDVKTVAVSIDEANIPSIGLFEKLGFVQIGRVDELLNYSLRMK